MSSEPGLCQLQQEVGFVIQQTRDAHKVVHGVEQGRVQVVGVIVVDREGQMVNQAWERGNFSNSNDRQILTLSPILP